MEDYTSVDSLAPAKYFFWIGSSCKIMVPHLFICFFSNGIMNFLLVHDSDLYVEAAARFNANLLLNGENLRDLLYRAYLSFGSECGISVTCNVIYKFLGLSDV